MAVVPELDLARIRQFCDRRVPSDRQEQARVEADAEGESVTIFDCRPPWRPDTIEWSRAPVAQLRHDPATHLWTLYWADGSGRWHRYEDLEPCTAEQVLQEIDSDPTCIFWG